jgi:hypothetical protein
MKHRQQIPRYSAIDNDMNLFNERSESSFHCVTLNRVTAAVMVVVACVGGASLSGNSHVTLVSRTLAPASLLDFNLVFVLRFFTHFIVLDRLHRRIRR